jgi:hypothetical protein
MFINKMIYSGVIVATLFCSAGFGAIIFKDDFSDPAASSDNWNTNISNATVTFPSGVCKVQNNNETGIIVQHNFVNDPKNFTISFTITKEAAANNAGMIICLQNNTVKGYAVTVNMHSTVYVYRLPDNVKLLTMQNSFVNNTQNRIRVSKSGSLFSVACNGEFLGQFTDDTYESGEIGLLADGKTTLNFDDIEVSDLPEVYNKRVIFQDNFDDGQMVGWTSFSSNVNEKLTETDDALLVTTPANKAQYIYSSMRLNNFFAKATTSHISGSDSSAYGLFLCGEPDAQNLVPMAVFCIVADRKHAIFTSPGSSSIVMNSNTAIRGKAYVDPVTGVKTYKTDTLKIEKMSGSGYVFYVNNVALDTIEANKINFQITGVGFYTSDAVSVKYDNFIASEAVGIRKPFTVYNSRINQVNGIRNTFTCDPRGRSIMMKTGKTTQPSASGFYLIKGINKGNLIIR